jgi:hypothetical protein
MKRKAAGKVEPLTFDWIWRFRLRLGSVVIIAAEPGAGVSLLCADLAARASSGEGWPGEPKRKASLCTVLMHSRTHSTLSGRLRVKQADLEKITLAKRVSLGKLRDAVENDTSNSMVFFDDLALPEDWALNEESQNPLAVGLNSLSMFAKSGNNAVIAVVKLSSSAATRRAELDYLNSHKNIVSLIVLERDGERTALRNHRNNDAPRFPPLEFGVRTRKRKGCEALKARYKPWAETAQKKKITQRMKAEEFLLARVYPGMTSAELLKAAKMAGVPRSTLHRARIKLGFSATYHAGARRAWSVKTPNDFKSKVTNANQEYDYSLV